MISYPNRTNQCSFSDVLESNEKCDLPISMNRSFKLYKWNLFVKAEMYTNYKPKHRVI